VVFLFFQVSDSDETQPLSPGSEIQPPSRNVTAMNVGEPELEPQLVETEAKEPMASSSDLTQYASQVIEHSDTDALNLNIINIKTGYQQQTHSRSIQLGGVLPLCEVGISTNIENQTLNTAETDTPYRYALDSYSLQLESTEQPSQHSPSTPAFKKQILNILRHSRQEK